MRGATIFAIMLALAACAKKEAEPPPRADDPVEFESGTSQLSAPVEIALSDVRRELEREIPRRLFSISQEDATCVAPEKVRIAFIKLKTPEIECDIRGHADRGRLQVTGRGEVFTVTMPVTAVVRASDIGGILKNETATARARVHADVRLDVDEGWEPSARVSIRYQWVDAPHFEFLGRRIDLQKHADEKLAPIVGRIETLLERRVANFGLRERMEPLWEQSFTVIELNRENPAVWMQVEPKALRYGGYDVAGETITLKLAMDALTTTAVGTKPQRPAPVPLPPRSPWLAQSGNLALTVPVIADYAVLEPVILRALEERAERPFDIPGLAPVEATFSNIRVYGTIGGRIAVGTDIEARLAGSETLEADGTVWITALPRNSANSRKVEFAELDIHGVTSSLPTELLLRIARSPTYRATIADALTQNFENDFDELLGKIDTALKDKRIGDVVLDASIESVQTGQLKAAGAGLYLPVEATADAALTYNPQ